MRVIYGARTLEIVSVLDPDGRRIELHLMCQEIR
jgi:head-tail adaptor